MSTTHLSVRMNGLAVGHLTQSASGELSFQYLPLARQALSVNMPVQETPFGHAACEAFFGGLLPTDDRVRQAIARRLGAPAPTTFALLRGLGHDCPGAVSIHDPEEPIRTEEGSTLDVDPLTESELAGLLRAWPDAPFLAGSGPLRLTLSGASPKLPVCLANGRPALPRPGTPTTHVLKAALAGAADNTLNEYLCLKLARAVGIEVPDAEIQEAEGLRYLLVTRFDRSVRRDGRLTRIHQETLRQALGQDEHSLDYKACFDLMMRFGAPARPVARLLRRVVFNVLIGNTRSDAGDYAILYPEGESQVMAPAYGFMCTQLSPEASPEMAIAIGGETRADRLTERNWQQFCKDASISYAILTRAMIHVSETLYQAIALERAALASPEADVILDAIEAHVGGVMARFQEQGAIA